MTKGGLAMGVGPVSEQGEAAMAAAPSDEEAFAGLVTRYSDSIWRFAVSKLGDAHEAEDVTQETFLRAYRSLDSWRGEATLRTWLHTICRNLCIDRLRARRDYVVSLDALGAAAAGCAVVTAHEPSTVLRNALTAALVVLSPDERDAFVLVDALGFSGEEAAQICEVAATTLRSRVHRAHRKLVEELQRGDV